MIFSVAVPVYRQAEFLPTALASLRAQSSAFQLAVMDATPDDSVQQVINSYDGFMHYQRHGSDKGQSAAIQEGWDHTNGDIVCWLCADDYLFPYTFYEVEKIFRERPDVDVVYGDSVFVNETGQFIRYFPSISTDISSIVTDCCISQPSCFARRSVVEQAGKLDVDLHYIMDWDLWTRLFKAGAKFHYLHKPLSATRIYQGTKTLSNSETRFAEIRGHLAKHADQVSAIRALTGFQMVGHYYPELRSSGTSRPRLSLRAMSGFLRQVKRTKQRFQKETKSLYGLDRLTNQVQGECEIYLPWYQLAPAKSAVVTTERNVNLVATIDGIVIQSSSNAVRERNQQVFEISAPLSNGQHYVHIRLEDTESAQWKLTSVNLN